MPAENTVTDEAVAPAGPRKRRPRALAEPLTLEAFALETRGEFVAVRKDIGDIRTLAHTQGERRTEDLRRMIHEEVGEQMTVFSADIKDLYAPVLAWIANAEGHKADDDAVREFVKGEMTDRAEKKRIADIKHVEDVKAAARAEAWRQRMDRTLTPLYPLMIGLFLLIVGGHASSAGAFSENWYYIGAGALGAILVGWTVYRGYFRPGQSSDNKKNGTGTGNGKGATP